MRGYKVCLSLHFILFLNNLKLFVHWLVESFCSYFNWILFIQIKLFFNFLNKINLSSPCINALANLSSNVRGSTCLDDPLPQID